MSKWGLPEKKKKEERESQLAWKIRAMLINRHHKELPSE